MHRAAYPHEAGRTPYVWLGRWERYAGTTRAPYLPTFELAEDKRTDDLVLTVGRSRQRVSMCVQLDMGRSRFSGWLREQAEELAALDLEAELEAAWRRVGA